MTLANKLTLSRIMMVPVFLVLAQLDFPHHWTVAALVFVLAALTDLLDGHIARKQGTVSGFGKIFDPIADKLLVLAALLPLTAMGRLSVWVTLILIGREFIVSAVRIQVSSQGGAIIAASGKAKVKTVLQYVAMVMMMMEGALPFLKNWYFSDGVMAVALVMTLWSLWEYCYGNREVFRGL
jgi:CDP-diacylglycerol--glycerol-3-phosphate 3-phosphatidyltransferase